MARKNGSPDTQDSTTTAPVAPTETDANSGSALASGTRLEVFSIKARGEKDSIWVRAGSAWVNRDGSINVYLDVLPLDGKLHVRPPLPKTEA